MLERLSIQHFRNLHLLELESLGAITLITGMNGSGKTSVLEAIHLLAVGRSFRSRHIRHFVEQGERYCQIVAHANEHVLGVRKQQDGETQLRLDGQTQASHAAFAQLLPVQLIDPESFSLIEGGSEGRRQLMDWLLFHVEPLFFRQWQHYQRALKQRNTALKQAASDTELSSWEWQLAELGEALHDWRLKLMPQWKEEFHQVLAELLPECPITMHYHPGFDVTQPLIETLVADRVRDRDYGYTRHGAHRADIRFKWGSESAESRLSRGQKKMLLMALKLSQTRLLHGSGKRSVVLLDDIGAELDAHALLRLMESLLQLRSQLFITTLDDNFLKECSLWSQHASTRVALSQGRLVMPV